MKLKPSLILFISVYLAGCKSHSRLPNNYYSEEDKVRRCRENWKFEPLTTETSLKILLHDEKGAYDLVSWPNFFIGVDSKGDTIGIIDYEAEWTGEEGDVLTFLPGERKNHPGAAIDSEMDEPVFTVNEEPEDNDLYCAVEFIYYGKLRK